LENDLSTAAKINRFLGQNPDRKKENCRLPGPDAVDVDQPPFASLENPCFQNEGLQQIVVAYCYQEGCWSQL
jgi:hypothetical protein